MGFVMVMVIAAVLSRRSSKTSTDYEQMVQYAHSKRKSDASPELLKGETFQTFKNAISVHLAPSICFFRFGLENKCLTP